MSSAEQDPSKVVLGILKEPHRLPTALSNASQVFVTNVQNKANLLMQQAQQLPEVKQLVKVSENIQANLEEMGKKLGEQQVMSAFNNNNGNGNAGSSWLQRVKSGPSHHSHGSGMRRTMSEKNFSTTLLSSSSSSDVDQLHGEGGGFGGGGLVGTPSSSSQQQHSQGVTAHETPRLPKFPRLSPPSSSTTSTKSSLPPDVEKTMEELAQNVLTAPHRALIKMQQGAESLTQAVKRAVASSSNNLTRTSSSSMNNNTNNNNITNTSNNNSTTAPPTPSSSAALNVALPSSSSSSRLAMASPPASPAVGFTSRGSALDMVDPEAAAAKRREATLLLQQQQQQSQQQQSSLVSTPPGSLKLSDVSVPWHALPDYFLRRDLGMRQQQDAGEGGSASTTSTTNNNTNNTNNASMVNGGKLIVHPTSTSSSNPSSSQHMVNGDAWITHVAIGPFQVPLPTPLQKRAFSIRDPGRKVAIVTTAALPWMTGTAVNPLLRAAYLARDGQRSVTLVVPWLAATDQRRVYPNQQTFATPQDQESFIREWCRKRTGFDSQYKIVFYPGRYAPEKGSILAVGDVTSCIPDTEADVAVLEEPEHLNWYHHGKRWTDKFNHVVGVVHTNYLDYARREENGDWKASMLGKINSWVCRSHCHKVVKLSGAVQPLPREVTEFVHGVSPQFLHVGEKKATAEVKEGTGSRFEKGVYFIGKVLWAKGYTELLDLMGTMQPTTHAANTTTTPSSHATSAHPSSSSSLHVDVFGSGDDLDAVKSEAGKKQLSMTFHGARDHLDPMLHEYKVFVNPSTSDVVATTTAEALAMGKFVIVPDLPCNHFFATFSNCLIYRNKDEFKQCIERAVHSEPLVMTEAERHRLTWEAATDRFLAVADVDHISRPGPFEAVMDGALAAVHNTLTGFEPLRRQVGAGANTKRAPSSLLDFTPSQETGGFFDNKDRAQAYHKKS